MGCPSDCDCGGGIARVGDASFIRVGSSAALQPHVKPGDLLVSEASLRKRRYDRCLRSTWLSAVPDLRITLELERCAREIAGNRASPPSTPASPSLTTPSMPRRLPGSTTELAGYFDVEMEASALYVVARLRGLRAGMICSCSSNLVSGASLYDRCPCCIEKLDG